MPKLHDRPEQLPLRLFVDVSVQTQALSCSVKKKEATSKGGRCRRLRLLQNTICRFTDKYLVIISVADRRPDPGLGWSKLLLADRTFICADWCRRGKR